MFHSKGASYAPQQDVRGMFVLQMPLSVGIMLWATIENEYKAVIYITAFVCQ